MAAFGTLTLLIALVVATYAGVASLIGARRGSRRLIESGRAGVYALAGCSGCRRWRWSTPSSSNDYSIKYVQHYSDATSPLFYKITAYWGGLDGSILWWVFLLSVFSAIAIYTNRHRHRELLPYVVDGADGDRRLLPLRDHLPQEPVRHLPHRIADRRARGSTRSCRTRTW